MKNVHRDAGSPGCSGVPAISLGTRVKRSSPAFLPLCMALFAAALSSATLGQSFPAKPIRLIVPQAPGGAPDVSSRILAQRISDSTGQQVIVENRPGAGGVVAAELVMRSPPDGYTLFVADTGHFGINPGLFPKLSYHPLKDFAPVTISGSTPLFFAVGAAVPAQNIRELLSLAKGAPGMLYGSSGNGTPHHLAMEFLKALAGVAIAHVPYKGVAQSVPAVLTGEVSVIVVGLPGILPHVKAGKARLLAVTTAERTPLLPEVPGTTEAGIAGLDVNVHFGYLAPAGTPRDVVMRLNAEFVKALAIPEVRQRLEGLSIVAMGTTPEAFAEQIRVDLQKYSKLVKDTGMRVD